jgi:dihydrolipoamide dehydrogenase
MAGKTPEPLDPKGIPFCVYSHPGVAGVGWTEQGAAAQGMEVKTALFPFRNIGMAAVVGEKEGLLKAVVSKKDDTILGLHILGEGAWDLAGEAVAAVTHGFKVSQLAKVVHPHPALCEVFGETADLLEGFPVHY